MQGWHESVLRMLYGFLIIQEVEKLVGVVANYKSSHQNVLIKVMVSLSWKAHHNFSQVKNDACQKLSPGGKISPDSQENTCVVVSF